MYLVAIISAEKKDKLKYHNLKNPSQPRLAKFIHLTDKNIIVSLFYSSYSLNVTDLEKY